MYDALLGDEPLEFWESERTRPRQTPLSDAAKELLRTTFERSFATCMRHPFGSPRQIRERQLERLQELVERAYATIPLYREKYDRAGFSPGQLRTWDDVNRIPIVTKDELIAAFPNRCVSPRYDPSDLFPTRSSGSSGKTLLIRVDLEAVITDTLQGIRQMALQSGLRYRPDHLLTHVYTVPWWADRVGRDYRSAFISSLIPSPGTAERLRELGPQVLSCYPSNLQSLLPYADRFSDDLYLVVTHSEHSAPAARQAWSSELGIPVRDEYSSEEATRIALELPCGHYHVCEDTVRLDVVDPDTFEPQEAGRPGLAVITNLLNEAMPFIRYLQGDYVTLPREPQPCAIGWSQLASIDGRANDAFFTRDGREIPAGSILDVTYRWMYDAGVNMREFELVQETPDLIRARLVPDGDVGSARLRASLDHLRELLTICLEHPVEVSGEILTAFPPRTGKRRPIRREFEAPARRAARPDVAVAVRAAAVTE